MINLIQKTQAVIVLYSEYVNDSITLNSIDRCLTIDEKLDVLVYDNSPKPQDISLSKFLNFNFNYIHNPENPGVSFAYNYGARFASELDKEWLLILDQDTCFNENLIFEYKKGIEQNKNVMMFCPILKIEKDVILSPCKFNYYGKHLKSVNPGINFFRDSSPINSGLLVNVASFKKVGGYNSNVPLDLSDHQFIERFKQYYQEYVVINSIGFQDFSALNDDKEKQLMRFHYYCKGILNFESDKNLKKPLLVFFLFLKMLKKTYRYKTHKFLFLFSKQISSFYKL